MTFPSYAERPAKFVAGARGLDFLNTVEWRGAPDERGDRLTSYDELLIWCEQGGLLSTAETARLRAEAGRRPRQASSVLKAAAELREAAAALASTGDERSVAKLNAALSGIWFELRVTRDGGGRIGSAVQAPGDLLRQPLVLIAREIVDTLTAYDWRAIRHCANDKCGWFFLDHSKNKSRRWCQMATCGNQAKAREHYARTRRVDVPPH